MWSYSLVGMTAFVGRWEKVEKSGRINVFRMYKIHTDYEVSPDQTIFKGIHRNITIDQTQLSLATSIPKQKTSHSQI